MKRAWIAVTLGISTFKTILAWWICQQECRKTFWVICAARALQGKCSILNRRVNQLRIIHPVVPAVVVAAAVVVQNVMVAGVVNLFGVETLAASAAATLVQ